MDSILTSVKMGMSGISEQDTSFDVQVIMFINSVFSILTQVGVGPAEGFFIEDADSIWDDYIKNDPVTLNMVKSYIILKTGLVFDPPNNAAVLSLKQEQVKELEWRLNIAGDEPIQNGGEG